MSNLTCHRVCACLHGYYPSLIASLSKYLLPSSECPAHLYGAGCSEQCACQHNASCDHVSGACQCAEGWRGRYCEKACPEGFFGQDCQRFCSCGSGSRSGHTQVVCGLVDVYNSCWEKCPNSCSNIEKKERRKQAL